MDNKPVQTLGNIVRVGSVSDVDTDKRTARVVFPDKADMVSGWLRVLDNRPTITVEKWVQEVGAEVKWDEYETEYYCADRDLGLDETYKKGDLREVRKSDNGSYECRTLAPPDVIKNGKVIKYEKRETISEGTPITCDGGHGGGVCSISSCPLEGIIEYKKHRQTVTVYPWLPYIGQMVVCLYLANGESDGFVIGGL